jgi:hypothetical protein
LALAVVSAAAFGIAYVSSPDEASIDFYSGAAQLIPLLLLTLVLNSRMFELAPLIRAFAREAQELGAGRLALVLALQSRDGDRESFVSDVWQRILVTLFTLALLAVAEFVALHPLATGSAQDGNPRVVYGVIAAAFVALGWLGVFGAPPDIPAADSERRARSLR